MSEAVIRAELARVAAELGAADVNFTLERPRDAGHGDLSTNLAMLVAKQQRTSLYRIVAEALENELPRIAAKPSPEDRWAHIAADAA